MNATRIALVLAVLAAYLGKVAFDEQPIVALIGFALPVWIALECCWRLLDPER
jgi:hypothetical protein